MEDLAVVQASILTWQRHMLLSMHYASLEQQRHTMLSIGTQSCILKHVKLLFNKLDTCRKGLYNFLKSVRNADGSFCLHIDGEVDIRGVYCALIVAKLTNVYTDELFKDTEKWIARCQTYEGGFSGCPGIEAHGGYAYCALAALTLLGKTGVINLSAFLVWFLKSSL